MGWIIALIVGGIAGWLASKLGYKGGIIRPLAGGHVLAVFSGATGEQDVEISQAALRQTRQK